MSSTCTDAVQDGGRAVHPEVDGGLTYAQGILTVAIILGTMLMFDSMYRSCRVRGRSASAPGGFTLIEIMVTLTVLAIILAIATPSLTALFNSNRLTTQANEMVGALQMARSEAIRRNARVSLCGSSDGATCADSGSWTHWLIVTGAGDQLIQQGAVKAPLVVSSADSRITFRADGLARDSSGALYRGVIGACLAVTRPAENRRVISIASGSRISITSNSTAGVCP